MSSVISLLDAAITTSGRIRKAGDRQKGLGSVLEAHERHLHQTREIIRVIKTETALQTASVSSGLLELEAITKKLVALLDSLSKHRSDVRQFMHQLVSGSRDEQELADVMGELGRAKANISLRLQVANVGLTSTVEKTVMLNAETVKRVDRLIQNTLGPGQGLKIAKLLPKDATDGKDGKDGKRPTIYMQEHVVHANGSQDDTLVPVDRTDLQSLNNDNPQITTDKSDPSQPPFPRLERRDTIGNFTRDQALQINGPVGEMQWLKLSNINIIDNSARDRSIQVNNVMSEEAFRQLMGPNRSDAPAQVILCAIGCYALIFLAHMAWR